MAGRITLSLLEYDVLWEHLRLGPCPPVIPVPPPRRTHHARRDLPAKPRGSTPAHDRGVPDSLADRREQGLHRLARPEWELDARLQDTARSPALIARAGRGV